MHRFCYHITNGLSRSALQCGTVTASTMEEAGREAARRAGLTESVEMDEIRGTETRRWVKDGKRRSVYVLHDPAL